MDMGLKGKTACVGGAGKVLGLAVAKGLAAEGCNLSICARNEQGLAKAAQTLNSKYGVQVFFQPVDLSRFEFEEVPVPKEWHISMDTSALCPLKLKWLLKNVFVVSGQDQSGDVHINTPLLCLNSREPSLGKRPFPYPAAESR